ncbi:MAG: ABC transporter ATP-binding protein [Clostridia bacterium]|jgi:ATP-binding cassette subfamily B protein|nr:ABC transporter ATP-binding protein [Clostridia bacterium]
MEEKKKKHKPINRKLLRRFMKGTWGYFIIAAIALIAAVLSAYIIPIITSFTIDYVLIPYAEEGYKAGDSGVPGFIINWIDSIGGREFLIKHLYIMGIALLLFTAVNAMSTFLRRSYIAYAGESMARNMRNDLYEHLANLPFDYHKHVSTGDLVQRCTSDVDTVRRFIQNQLLEIARTVLMVVCAAVIMLRMNPMLTLWSVIMMPFLALSSFVYFKAVKDSFSDADEAEGKLSAALQENLTGVRVVRAFGQQKRELDNFTEKNADFRKKNLRVNNLMAYYWSASDAFGYMQIMLALCVGVYYAIKGWISVGELLVFTSYTAMLTWPVRQLGRILADLGKASVSLGRIDEIISAPLETEPGKALTPPITGDIEFRHVGFRYEDSVDPVLDDVSFTVKHGQTIAILGSTGSGKTSLVQLIQRLYTATEGEILLDGVNINDYERHYLRRNIGIVLQEPFLYSRTIMENIRIVDPDAPEEKVYEAARIASIHDVVKAFENGYDTVVGERGVTLSGGQKQRVAIARMLMQEAPIIILDDSMSAVDTETDAAIREALSGRRQNCTTFIISHRITTLSTADKILVLEHGRLVQQGTHEELIKVDGLYKRIADIQNMLEGELGSEGGEA